MITLQNTMSCARKQLKSNVLKRALMQQKSAKEDQDSDEDEEDNTAKDSSGRLA